MSCFLFHKWSKWEQYIQSVKYLYDGLFVAKEVRGKMVDYEEKRQKRYCEKCGFMQDEKIKD